MSNQVQVQSKHLTMLSTSESQIQAAMGPGGDAKRFVRLAITEFRANPKLATCNPESFMLSLYEGARLGLEVGKQLGQFYLIPRGSEVVPMLGYRGMLVLAMRHPDVMTITSTAVFKGDYFEHGENMQGQFFEYRPCGNKNPEELEKVFAVCRLKSGGVILDVMEKAEIDIVRAKSQMPNGLAWREFPTEMSRKTAVRRLFKYIPLMPEVQEAVQTDEERWGELIQEIRKPQLYQSAMNEAEKKRLVENAVLEINLDKSKLAELQEDLLKRGVNIQQIVGMSWPAICDLEDGPQVSNILAKVKKYCEEENSRGAKK